VHFAGEDAALGFLLLRAVREGAVVALQGDRPRADGRTVAVSLFGRPFDVPAGPLVLARSAPAPLLPVFVLREGVGRDRVCFRAPIPVEDVEAAAQGLAREIEWAIRREPHQWFCWRRLWPRGGGSGTYVPSTPSATVAPSAPRTKR
jgi:KDO2-lipid IV(A) lauroyltransferase